MPDTSTLHVRANPPALLPRSGRPGFVGYETAPTSQAADTDYVVPDGLRYRLKADPENVPNNSYYRRAIARGDIMDADAAPEPEDEASTESSDAPAVDPPPVIEEPPAADEQAVLEEPPAADEQAVLEEPPAEPVVEPEPALEPVAEPTEPAAEPAAEPEPEQSP